VGDFIIVDDCMGTVEQVGLKTTRIRSLSGEQLVMSNGDLLKARLRNYKRMHQRRVVFSFGVLYQTSADQLEGIPKTVRAIVESQGKARFDRAHLMRFGDSSLDFEVVYWVLDPDYNVHMDIQQAIHLGLIRKFEQEGISFAYPTRTVILEGAAPSQARPQPDSIGRLGSPGTQRTLLRDEPDIGPRTGRLGRVG
jgi:small-conductance mechanosensitive channel